MNKKDIEILETFSLANIPEIIDQDEFNNVKEAIKNLLNRNKELEKQMGKDLDVVYLQGVYNERDKWKNKIKEKFNYYNDLYKQDNSPNEFLISQDCLSKLSILRELLLED